MKKIVALVLSVVLTLSCCVGLASAKGNKVTLYVYNWGQYIAEGDDDSIDVIAAFEEAYPNIKVKYSTFDSNESMYAKLSNGGITVDVIIPSDYMIGRMRQEGMLLELNYDNIPNAQYIDDSFKNMAYDPESKYSVPYTWGTVGIIYNTKYVDEADVTGWELLWNEKYAGKILMFDNSRDAFGIAQYLLGYSANTTDEAELQACADKLAEQKPVVQQYVMDQIFDAMENEEAWIAPYYAGDFLTMVEENEDLAFYRPAHQGYNVFIDAMCIPTCCKEKEAAELFINFLCDPEISAANMDFIGYSVPASESKQYMDEEVVSDPVAYPDAEELRNATSFDYLPEDVSRKMESLFMAVRHGKIIASCPYPEAPASGYFSLSKNPSFQQAKTGAFL